MTLVDLVPNLKKKNANEYAGPCPWCGGSDRFVVWPLQGSGGRYSCRRCLQRGDAIDLLRAQGSTYQEAKFKLSQETHRSNLGGIGDLGTGSILGEKKNAAANRAMWNASASSFIRNSLEHTDAKTIREWQSVLTARNLKRDTAIEFGIGWNPIDLYLDERDWGLPGDRKLKIPRGLIIPINRADQFVSIKIRRPSNDPKYWQVRGGTLDCLVLGKEGLPTVVVESDLDAYLIYQEAGESVGVVSLAGVNKSIDSHAALFLERSAKIFISTDFDEPKAGTQSVGQAAYHELKKRFPRAEYLPPAVGKDPCEMHSQGIPVKLWLSCALASQSNTDCFKLPADFPGSWEWFQKSARSYPHLVACPKATPKWYWRYRTACEKCSGHIHCIKDLELS